jgi:hypothetical protein
MSVGSPQSCPLLEATRCSRSGVFPTRQYVYNRFCTTEKWRYYEVLETFKSTWNASIKILEYQQQQLRRGVHEFRRLYMEGLGYRSPRRFGGPQTRGRSMQEYIAKGLVA